METCHMCDKEYTFYENNDEGFERKCFVCSPKEVIGHPKYLIYSDGRIWSNKRNIYLKHTLHKTTGYYRVHLDDKMCKVHRLIGLHFIPNPENKSCIDHINREKTDNRLENLRWSTHQENMQNQTKSKKNTSGYKYIHYDRTIYKWKFKKIINGKLTQKYFEILHDALIYKFIFLLKNPQRF